MEHSTLIGTFIKSFNNREIAILIWFIVFVGFVSSSKGVRDSAKNVLKSIFGKRILFTLLTMLFYLTLEISILNLIGFWDTTQLKNAIVWVLFVAVGLFFSMHEVESKNKRLDKFFISILWTNFKFILILEFIVNLHTFNIFFEFICIGFITICALLSTFISTDEKHSQLKNICDYFVSAYGLVVLVYSIIITINNFSSFVTFETLLSFLFPILLTILFIPFLYVFSLIFIYEKLFLRLEFFFKENHELKRFTKRKLFGLCKLRTSSLQKFNEYGMASLINAKNEQDVLRIISGFNENNETESD